MEGEATFTDVFVIGEDGAALAASSFLASIWNVLGSVSTNTGIAYCRRTAFTVAMNVYRGTITSSPGMARSSVWSMTGQDGNGEGCAFAPPRIAGRLLEVSAASAAPQRRSVVALGS